VHATAKRRVVRQKTVEHLSGQAIKDSHHRPTSRTRPGNYLGASVSVDITGSHENATMKICAIGQKVSLGPEGTAGSTIKYPNVWRHPRPGSSDDFGAPVTVDITGSHPDATCEGGRIRLDDPGIETSSGTTNNVYGWTISFIRAGNEDRECRTIVSWMGNRSRTSVSRGLCASNVR
jgi:hypothetical protein